MFYPQEVIEEVRGLSDIVDVVGAYVRLQRRSGNYVGLCPFHREKTPSFNVSPDKQMYHCFGCGAGGNVISFLMQIENFDFPDALRHLANRAGYTLPERSQSASGKARLQNRDRLRAVHKAAALFFHEHLAEDAAAARYLDGRGLTTKIRKRFGLGLAPRVSGRLTAHLREAGYSPEEMLQTGLVRKGEDGRPYEHFRGRLMFPILDLEGHVTGFGGRAMEDGAKAKYINSPESELFSKSRQLYGIHAARKAKSREIIVVEGYMDALSLHQAGFTNAVGVLGTALTAHHVRLLKRVNCRSVLLLLDSDEAGTKAALRAIPELLSGGLKVKVLQVRDAKDPDEYIQRHGPGAFGHLLSQAEGHMTFRINLLKSRHNLDATEGRIAFTQEVAKLLASLEDAIEADAYIREAAQLSGISEDAVRVQVQKLVGLVGHGSVGRDAPARRGVMGMSGFTDTPGFTGGGPGFGESTTARRGVAPYNRPPRGLTDARAGLVSVALAHPAVGRALEGHLDPAEMGGAVGQALLEAAYEAAKTGTALAPADAVARFPTLEAQQEAAGMLRGAVHFDTPAEMEKAVNAMWKIIKRAAFDARLQAEQQDQNAINTLFIAKKDMEKQYITILNG